MRKAATILATVLLAGGMMVSFDGSHSAWNAGPRAARAEDYAAKSAVPPEATGFNGTLIGEVVAAGGPGWFIIKVDRVVSFSAGNRTKSNVAALTTAWAGKYSTICGKNMPAVKVGDTIGAVCFQAEAHLNATKVEIAPPPDAKPATPPATVAAPVATPHPTTPPTTAPAARVATSQPVQNPEDQARSKLQLYQLYMDGGLKDQARKTLQDIIQQYPKTETAKDAQGKLKELEG